MQMGLLMLGDASVQTMVERARLADAVGYGTVWLADERFYREVYACLAHFAACTSKVLLGPCVTDPYSRHPALTAMAIAGSSFPTAPYGGSTARDPFVCRPGLGSSWKRRVPADMDRRRSATTRSCARTAPTDT